MFLYGVLFVVVEENSFLLILIASLLSGNTSLLQILFNPISS